MKFPWERIRCKRCKSIWRFIVIGTWIHCICFGAHIFRPWNGFVKLRRRNPLFEIFWDDRHLFVINSHERLIELVPIIGWDLNWSADYAPWGFALFYDILAVIYYKLYIGCVHPKVKYRTYHKVVFFTCFGIYNFVWNWISFLLFGIIKGIFVWQFYFWYLWGYVAAVIIYVVFSVYVIDQY